MQKAQTLSKTIPKKHKIILTKYKNSLHSSKIFLRECKIAGPESNYLLRNTKILTRSSILHIEFKKFKHNPNNSSKIEKILTKYKNTLHNSKIVLAESKILVESTKYLLQNRKFRQHHKYSL